MSPGHSRDPVANTSLCFLRACHGLGCPAALSGADHQRLRAPGSPRRVCLQLVPLAELILVGMLTGNGTIPVALPPLLSVATRPAVGRSDPQEGMDRMLCRSGSGHRGLAALPLRLDPGCHLARPLCPSGGGPSGMTTHGEEGTLLEEEAVLTEGRKARCPLSSTCDKAEPCAPSAPEFPPLRVASTVLLLGCGVLGWFVRDGSTPQPMSTSGYRSGTQHGVCECRRQSKSGAVAETSAENCGDTGVGSRTLGRGTDAPEEWAPHRERKRFPVSGSHGKRAGEFVLAQECWQPSLPCDLWPETKVAWETWVRVPTAVWALGYWDGIMQPGEARWTEDVLLSTSLHIPGRTEVRSSPGSPTLEPCDLLLAAPGSWEQGELTGWALLSCDSAHPGLPARRWLCISSSHSSSAPRPATRGVPRMSKACLLSPENLSLLHAINRILSNSLFLFSFF